MADETDNETQAEQVEPVAEEAQAEPQATAGEPQAAAEGAAEQPPAEEAPARGRRARKAAKPRPREPMTPAERHAERVAARKVKAARRRARRLQERAKAAERRSARPAPQDLPPVHAPTEGTRRERQGVVVSAKADKTITVRIDMARRHLRYKKIVRGSTTLHAHDETNEAHEGDVVRVIESRPLSATKRWRLVDVLERAR